MTNILNPGAIGQYKGPFNSGFSIELSTEHEIQMGISIGEKDAMHQLASVELEEQWFWAIEPLTTNIDNNKIVIGHKCIYNPNEGIFNHIITFPNGAPASTILDYIILE